MDPTVYKKMLENIHDAIIVSQDGETKYVNSKILELLGYDTEEELVGKGFNLIIHPDDYVKVLTNHQRRLKGEQFETVYEFRAVNKKGIPIPVEIRVNVFEWEGRPATLNFLIDITGRKRMETQLLQTQKMEAIGTLAGGVAHEFNNLLMGIQGYISLMLLHKDSIDPDFAKLNNMQSLVQSGADLAAKLLGFARGGQYEPKPSDLNELVSKTVNIFGRTKKGIMIHQKYEKNIWPAEVDRIQIEQVLINLYVNAGQAMTGDGGDIYVETDNITLSDADVLSMNIQAGNYVRITITDTGRGMDEETCHRIFEPFFTTKEKGQGVGLGLASAYGIIKEHGGIIDVTSELGHGTIFSIYLPASSKEISRQTSDAKIIIKGNETILLVDDEASIVDVCGEMLSILGYNVLQAGNGKDALKIYEINKGRIDLVILDMIMPGLSGGETFDALRLIDPGVKVMLSTGYIISEQAKRMMGKGCRAFIQKPFRLEELSRKIREVFDQSK